MPVWVYRLTLELRDNHSSLVVDLQPVRFGRIIHKAFMADIDISPTVYEIGGLARAGEAGRRAEVIEAFRAVLAWAFRNSAGGPLLGQMSRNHTAVLGRLCRREGLSFRVLAGSLIGNDPIRDWTENGGRDDEQVFLIECEADDARLRESTVAPG